MLYTLKFIMGFCVIKSKFSTAWVKIAKLLPGRTDNMCLQRYRRLKKWSEQGKEKEWVRAAT